MKPAATDTAGPFQHSQIIGLEHQHSVLYAEVIDIVKMRQVCWGRPLTLAVWPAGTSPHAGQLSPEPPVLYDLRQGADILLPVSLFRPALDTEIIPLLAQLQAETKNQQADAPIIAHRQLRNFIQQVCTAHPNDFRF
ncbi:MAG: hypothetical protein KME26_23840 [Oscillatoria princeps RMCB-10]|jgi:hypothetical protein|nr:hypothetical protein [Oscillatoria princeps RMCB-10]